MNSPIAQDSAARSRGQRSDSSLFQRSGKNKVENRPESPWLARELERFYGNDLYDVLRSPVQEQSLREDVIRQAKTELKHHDSAINKHLVKKAALEQKSESWLLDSGVSSDSDEGAADPFQIKPAIEKRILELEEASKRQDLAIQKHNSKKAALERGMELWQRSLGRDSAQNGVSNYDIQCSTALPTVVHSSSQNNFPTAIESAEKAPKKGPAAGPGHEGYGKYARRGRSGSASASLTLGCSCHARYSESPRHYRESSRYKGYSDSSRYPGKSSPYFSGPSRCNDYSDSCRCPSGSSRTQATPRLDEYRRNTNPYTAHARSDGCHRTSDPSMDEISRGFERMGINGRPGREYRS